MMNEREVRAKLKKMGYSLKTKRVPVAEIGSETIFDTRYLIVDANNVLVTGEQGLSLDEIVEGWFSKTYDFG